ncbi:MAG: L-histidine N(alpha)-methyltransferase [Polyangiaceae bacterium]|nr:L-histidine N(alpha)-methyltransferase [Polyangiaceae bacterium]
MKAEESLSTLASDVARGLSSTPKQLPPYLFYDEEGSRLYEQITELPEYYPTRTERAILERHATDIVSRVASGSEAPLRVVELGAGTATKTRLVLEAVVQRQGRCLFMPIDVSRAALEEAEEHLARDLPSVDVRPFVGLHSEALQTIRALGPRRLVLFIGSSIGNFEDDEALELLRGVRAALAAGGALLLGTDLRKDPERLVPAYDDAAGVTAAFNRNVLTRINRELGGSFDPSAFEHVALWNEQASRIEMHLESKEDQSVLIERLGLVVHLKQGERIHTESSIKYDLARVDALLSAAGFERETTYTDDEDLFAVHLARAAG